MSRNNDLILDVDENPKRIRDWLLFAIQHVLAMLVACITVPKITGLPIPATLIATGLGTVCYILVTKKKSPIYLSSSFAFITPITSAMAVGGVANATGDPSNVMAVMLGVLMVAAVYLIISLIIAKVGTKWLNKLLPPILVGPIIIVIGLSLSSSAIANLSVASGSNEAYNLLAILCGMVALFVTALCSHYGKGKLLSLIPFIIGMLSGYGVAIAITLIGYTWLGNAYCNIVDFTPFVNIFAPEHIGVQSFFNYKVFVPNDTESFLFLRFDLIKQFNWITLGEVALLFVPVALVTVCEHIGDHENLGNIIGRDLLHGEPGLKRTLGGEALAVGATSVLCGTCVTTYGENVAVIGTTKNASINVILLAAILSVAAGLFTPFTAFLQTIPACVTGGVSILMYGFIASSGIKMIVKERIDFNKSKNIFITSAVLVSGIGGLTLKFIPTVVSKVNEITICTEEGVVIGQAYTQTSTTVFGITITSMAIAMILGIILNLILKDEKPVEEVK